MLHLQKYKTIDRYILLKYLKTFVLALALIIIIVITFDVSEKLDDFIGNHAPIGKIVFQYYLNFIPNFVNLYSPLFIFISVIFFTSKMAGNSEVIAILGSGISYRRMLRPYLHGSCIVAMAVLLLGCFVIPVSNRQLDDFERTYIKTGKRSFYSNLHFQAQRGVQVYTESFDVQRNRAARFHLDIHGPNGALTSRTYADIITYDSARQQWQCLNYYHRAWNNGHESLVHRDSAYVDLHLTPTDFNVASYNIETMNIIRLSEYIQEERTRGSGALTNALIEYYQRLLNPLAIIIMSFIGVAISSRKTRGGTGVHLAIGISIAFTFVVFMKVATVFAINGNLPPFLAVLMPQIVFGTAALYLIRTAPK